MNDFSIELGVSLNTTDLKKKINNLDNKYKLKLGVDVGVDDIRKRISSYNKNTNNAKLKLGVKLDTSDLKKQINQLNKSSGMVDGKGIAIPVNTQSLEKSLREVKDIIASVQKSLGNLDDGAGTKSLVASVNQIASALEKATTESDGLVASLNALSKKDFSVNIGVNMNKSAAAVQGQYGDLARGSIIPQLKQQIDSLVKYYNKEYKTSVSEMQALTNLVSGTELAPAFFNDLLTDKKNNLATRMGDSSNLKQQIAALREFITIFQKAANLKGFDITSVTSGFTQTAEQLATQAEKARTGVTHLDDSMEKLKGVFGSGVDGEKLSAQLDSIVTDLNEIKSTLQELSSGASLDGLTASFNKLSDSIELLIKNCTTAKDVVNDVIGNAGAAGQSGSGFKNVENDLKQVESAAESASDAIQKMSNTGRVNTGFDNVENDLREITVTSGNTADAIDNLKNAMSSMKFNTSSIDAAIKDLEEMKITISEVTAKENKNGVIQITVKGVNEAKEAVTVVKQLNEATGSFDIVNTKISKPFDDGTEAAKRLKKEVESVKNIKFNFEAGTFENQMDKMYFDFNKLSDATQELRINYEATEQAYKELKSAYNANTGDEVADRERLIQAEERYAQSLKKTTNLIKQQSRADSIAEANDRLADAHKSLELDMLNWLKKNSKAAKEYEGQIYDLIEALRKLEQAGKLQEVDVRSARRQFNNLDREADLKDLKGLTLFDKIKQKAKEYSAYFSVAEVFMYAEQALREMFNTVLEIDTAMTGLYRVTDLTAAQYNTLYDNMIASAKEYGATLTDIINATTDWVRAGFDADDALGLAEVTTMYQHISDLDYDTASENLITAYNGFKQELLDLYDGDEVAAVGYIADIFNELDNNFAVTAAGLGDALTRSASALDLAGNSIQETAGMVTGIVEVTQDPEKAGSALKILSLRLRGMKGELEELGEETDENVENLSKMQGQILNMTSGKVNIFEADGSFKSTYEIMQGIAEVWDDLSSIDQADLLETVAGKHRANDVAALLSNWENVEAAVKAASEAEGSAAAENAKYVDSMQGRLDKLTTVWQSFANTFMESDFLKGAISALTEFVEILEGLIENLGTVGTIGLGAGIFSFFKDRKGLFDVFKGLKSLITFNGVGSFTKSLTGVAGAIGLITATVGLAINAYKNYREEQSRVRQETIASSDEFLDAAGSFEQAYIKYSGKTSLTSEEEAELESAINGIVDALGNKSNALQDVVNSSNDYVASLEQIAREELKAAASAAKAKRDAAATELEETAFGWAKWDGSEVNTAVYGEAADIAEDIAKKYDAEFVQTATKVINDFGATSQNLEIRLPTDGDADDIVQFYNYLLEVQEELSNNALANTDDYKNITSVINELADSVKVYTEGLYDAAKAEYQLAYGIPKTTSAYLKMRETILSDMGDMSFETRESIADSLDNEYSQYFDLSTNEAQARKLIGLVDEYGNTEASQIETFLDMRTKVNGDECSVGDYISQFDEIDKMTEGWSDKSKEELNASFGLDSDKIKTQYDKLYNYLSKQNISALNDYEFTPEFRLEKDNIKEQEIEDFLGGLSTYELAAVANLKAEINWEKDSWEDIINQIEEEASLIEALSFDISLELETEKLENLNTAITESISGAGLGETSLSFVEDMFSSLDGYDQSKLFERTANGIRLNSDELRKLNDDYKKTNVDGLENKMSALGDRYNQTKEELYDLTYGTAEYKEKARDLSDIEAQINATEKQIALYQGLTSAYQTWQRAESSGNQRDMYENVLGGFETVEDELSRGWLDDSSVEFLRLLKGDKATIIDGKGNKKEVDIATASVEDFKKVWNSLDDTIKNTSYSVKDFFTTDEDGNSTSKGVYNFLDAVGQLEEEAFGGKDVVKRDEDGNVIEFDFQMVGGNEAIAEALGVSEELVDIMVRAADDAGFVISMDGTYQQLDVLKEKAEKAAKALKDAFKKTEHNFFEDGSEKGVLADYQEAMKIWETFKANKNKDGTIDMAVEGAEEAYTLVSTLQSMVDQLSEPVYMELNASQVEKDMQVPLSKLQEYERLTQTEHQLQLKSTDTSKIEASKEEILDYFDELQESNPEIAAEIGIEGLTREEIEAKIDAGEIEIPATIDLQVEMNDTLKDMVNVALYNAGLIDKEELEKRVDIKLYADEIDTSDVENKTEDAVEKSDSEIKREQHIEVIAETFGVDNVEALSTQLEGLDDKTIQAIAEVLGRADVEQLKHVMGTLDPVKVEAIAKAIGEGDVDALKTAINSLEPNQVDAIARALGYSDVNELNAAVEGMDGNTVQAIAQALGITDVNTLQAVINNMQGNTVDAKVNTDGQAGKISSLQSSIDSLVGTTVDIFVNTWKTTYETVASGGKSKAAQRTGANPDGKGGVDGTAHINGTTGKAFKQGNWGTKDSGVALMGELGRETIVRDGKFFTVGDDGAGFYQYKKGDIIFNHKQTEELFKNGKVTSDGGRGKMFANGTAFVEGTVSTEGAAFSSGTGGGFWTNEVTGGTYGKPKDDNSFEETIDWIEITFARIERAIDNLDRKVNSVYKSWADRNEALTEQISKVSEEIGYQERARDEYYAAAEAVGLEETYVNMVKYGDIDIETIKDETLKEKIDDYKKYYEAALECQDAIDELKEKEAELYAQSFELAQNKYDHILQGFEHTEAMLDEYISQAEAKGHIVSKEYYNALIDNEQNRIKELQNEQSALIDERQKYFDYMKSQGHSEEYIKNTEQWYEMSAGIDDVTQSIEESNTALIEYANNMEEVNKQIYRLKQDRISHTIDEADFLTELLSYEDLHDDNGKLTDAGMSTIALHGQKQNTYMYQADEAAAEAARRKELWDKDKSNTEAEEAYYEALEEQYDYILKAKQEEQEMIDLIKEGIEIELDALQERIDKYEESLDSAKELYEYQKKISETSKEIGDIRKQLSAYEGDTSEEAKAKIQELRVSLEEAEQSLEEQQYDKYISDQKALLDNLYLEYEQVLNERVDNQNALLSEIINSVNLAASAESGIATTIGTTSQTIGETLAKEADEVGVTLSDTMKDIWSTGDGNIKAVLTDYCAKFDMEFTTIITVLNGIRAGVDGMVVKLNAEAEKKVKANKTTTSAKKNPIASSSAGGGGGGGNKTGTGDGKPKIGDKVTFVSGQYYYDSQGKKPLGSKYRGKQVYITNINERDWATHGYHISTGNKLGKGDLGWLKLDQLKGYATGKKNFSDDELAWTQEHGLEEYIIRPSDGAILTPVARQGSVLTPQASNNIWDMANSPAEFIRDNLNLGTTNVPNNANTQNNYVQHLDKVVFSLPNVRNYDELLSEMQKDKNFERLINAMTIDRIAGKSSLGKGKSIR